MGVGKSRKASELRRKLLGGPSALLVDPLGFDAGDSNLYRYVNNEPVLYFDRAGLQAVPLVETRPSWKIKGSFQQFGKEVNLFYRQFEIGKIWVGKGSFWVGNVRAEGIRIGVKTSKEDGAKIHFVQTYWAQLHYQRAGEGSATKELEFILKSADGSLVTTSTGGNLRWGLDGGSTGPDYQSFTTELGGDSVEKWMPDIPTFAQGLVYGARQKYSGLRGTYMIAQVFFTTYILYQKTVVGRVRWTTTYWLRSISILSGGPRNVRNDVSIQTPEGNLSTGIGSRAGPMSEKEIDVIKTMFPKQNIVSFDPF
jgi:hypothetical protein